jgi:hypothetical protein
MEVSHVCSGREDMDVVNALWCGMAQDADRVSEWDAPESSFDSASLENGWSVACDGDVVVVMDCGSIVSFAENGNISIVGKSANAEKRVG